MKTDLFDFELPTDRIALRPASPRDAARLLVVRPGVQRPGSATPPPFAPAKANGEVFEDRSIGDLPGLLRPGDCLVVNDSKVIAARLHGCRIGRGATEPAIEATLHKRMARIGGPL
jgi:S-adenosylmethionine:tRNA ribosyltransferase-isomerase